MTQYPIVSTIFRIDSGVFILFVVQSYTASAFSSCPPKAGMNLLQHEGSLEQTFFLSSIAFDGSDYHYEFYILGSFFLLTFFCFFFFHLDYRLHQG